MVSISGKVDGIEYITLAGCKNEQLLRQFILVLT